MLRSTERLVLTGWFLASTCWIGAVAPSGARAEESISQLYEQKCVSCHGADGQGVEGVYESTLAGTRSVEELTLLIERTMPEDDPEDCVGDEASQMAQYIYDAFYSVEARQRLGIATPLRVELMRLTVPQFRNSVADLLAHFTPGPAETRAAWRQSSRSDAALAAMAAVDKGRR